MLSISKSVMVFLRKGVVQPTSLYSKLNSESLILSRYSHWVNYFNILLCHIGNHQYHQILRVNLSEDNPCLNVNVKIILIFDHYAFRKLINRTKLNIYKTRERKVGGTRCGLHIKAQISRPYFHPVQSFFINFRVLRKGEGKL